MGSPCMPDEAQAGRGGRAGTVMSRTTMAIGNRTDAIGMKHDGGAGDHEPNWI